jgi:hypothetical protein
MAARRQAVKRYSILRPRRHELSVAAGVLACRRAAASRPASRPAEPAPLHSIRLDNQWPNPGGGTYALYGRRDAHRYTDPQLMGAGILRSGTSIMIGGSRQTAVIAVVDGPEDLPPFAAGF